MTAIHARAGILGAHRRIRFPFLDWLFDTAAADGPGHPPPRRHVDPPRRREAFIEDAAMKREMRRL
ncbi:hypothetical protein FHR72_004904 [Mycolicibacterium iranicum]|uniref:Uncharacterized protein n=1 Tax=Mycolicibacterium iranicum TaxID=912594 RepID=A0A839QH21_MYCIR|nr:hypothetical protein [Mycolicibacterium iranicum]MBB2993396.1 hypothetical protein [Mycolicibacterium iranicum]